MCSQLAGNVIISILPCTPRKSFTPWKYDLQLYEKYAHHKKAWLLPLAIHSQMFDWVQSRVYISTPTHKVTRTHLLSHIDCTLPSTIIAFVNGVYVVYRVPHANRQHLNVIPTTIRVLNYLCLIVCTNLSFAELTFTLKLNTFSITRANFALGFISCRFMICLPKPANALQLCA